jgi:hypothetical protein
MKKEIIFIVNFEPLIFLVAMIFKRERGIEETSCRYRNGIGRSYRNWSRDSMEKCL